jgi:hypothetical protein
MRQDRRVESRELSVRRRPAARIWPTSALQVSVKGLDGGPGARAWGGASILTSRAPRARRPRPRRGQGLRPRWRSASPRFNHERYGAIARRGPSEIHGFGAPHASAPSKSCSPGSGGAGCQFTLHAEDPPGRRPIVIPMPARAGWPARRPLAATSLTPQLAAPRSLLSFSQGVAEPNTVSSIRPPAAPVLALTGLPSPFQAI